MTPEDGQLAHASMEPRRNRLLASLPIAEFARIAPRLERVSLRPGTVLHAAGRPVGRLLFPIDCLVALLHGTSEGKSAEVALIGNEGLVGAAAYLGARVSPERAVTVGPGDALAIPLENARELGPGTTFHRRLLLFIQALMTQLAQTALCIRHHSIEQQVCRSLLLSFDRLQGDALLLTHETFADMLGVRRVGVTGVAKRLQERGVIRYRRGRIMLVDRPALESAACECYRQIHAEYQRLLGS